MDASETGVSSSLRSAWNGTECCRRCRVCSRVRSLRCCASLWTDLSCISLLAAASTRRPTTVPLRPPRTAASARSRAGLAASHSNRAAQCADAARTLPDDDAEAAAAAPRPPPPCRSRNRISIRPTSRACCTQIVPSTHAAREHTQHIAAAVHEGRLQCDGGATALTRIVLVAVLPLRCRCLQSTDW
jgi:hypothetical protein